MDRRDFLKQVGLWYAGLLASSPVFNITSRAMAQSPGRSEIVIARDDDYLKMVVNILENMGGMKRFVNSGDRVVVKPNIAWDRSPDQAANTHPLVVKALVSLALEAGASTVRVFDRTCNEERRCYHNSGIKPVLDAMGDRRVRCEYIDDRKFIPVIIKRGRALREWAFYKDALEADAYINVPVAKHHGLTRLTLGMKNVMGVIGGQRGRIHHNIAQNLADLNTVIRPALTVVDATRILLRNGPQGGRLEDVRVLDTILASTDPVAVDAYAATLFDLPDDAVQSTVLAHEMGLGEIDLDKCRITSI